MELGRRWLHDPASAPTGQQSEPQQRQHHVHGHEATTRPTYNPSTGFNTNIVIITAAILLVLVCALGMNSLIKRFWWNLRIASRGASLDDAHSYGSAAATSPPKGIKKKELRCLPTLIYRASTQENLDLRQEVAAQEDQGSCNICAICLSEFQTGERLRAMPTCRHLFHASCVDTWLSKNSSCPTCRGDFTSSASSSLPPPQKLKLSQRVQLQIVITTSSSQTSVNTTASMEPTTRRVVSVVGPPPLQINCENASSSSTSSTLPPQ